MPVIKANNAPIAAAPFSMRDIEEQGRLLLLRARQRAEGLLAEAQKEAEVLKTAARREGLAEGRRQGIEEGKETGRQLALDEHRAELAKAISSLKAATAELDASRRRLEAEALGEVVELALRVARRVTKRQAAIDPAVLEENLKEAMKRVVSSADVRVAVNPEQLTVLNDALPRLALELPALQHVSLVEDSGVSIGGCRLFTACGGVDADLDAQLDRVFAEIRPPAPENAA